MTEQAKVPEIRFAGFTDPWEQRKFSNLTDRVSMQSSDPDLPQVEYEDIVSGEGTLNKDLRDKEGGKTGIKFYAGDVLYGKLRPYLMNWLYPQFNGVAVGDFWVLRATECDSSFLYRLVQTDSFQRLANVSSGSKMPRADWNLISQSFFAVPADYAEQRVIAKSLAELDDLITLHQRKYDKLVVFKKSMLEKMFPKDGESVPEIRFAGFTDPWEQRKLGDVASSFDYGLNAAATEYDGQNKYLRITDIDDETHEFSKSDLTTPLADLAMSADYLLKEGDLLFARTGASVGKTYLYRQFDGMVYFAGFLIRARIGEGADPEFAYQATLTDAYKKYVAITSQRSGQPGVNAQEYADYQLMLPSKTEQQQIGMTLRSLDDLITLHQRKLELLQNIKKSLLDKMFV
ncbi:restriction endonuclease S subunit [Bifidobacterium longum subsp. longum]|uniref:restriction endonuclease subunit S n=1 Tax=Bifidobacterium longum TaxID=216816 RepID=UPI0010E98391|nr:restriction endonuclease S subunit [Bifidobacterium longum subsp. longum]TCF55831.1 restriction endonuclease S subunit [Bifidobacterium longum subsp. longum]